MWLGHENNGPRERHLSAARAAWAGAGGGDALVGTGGQEPPWEEETAGATGVWGLSVGPALVLATWSPGYWRVL